MSLSKYKIFILINVFFVALLIFEYFLFLLSGNFSIKIIQAELIIFTFYSIIRLYKLSRNWFSLDILFIFVFTLFLSSRIFLNFLFPDTYTTYGEDDWSEYYFSEQTNTKLTFVILFSLMGIYFGMLIGYSKFKNIKTKFHYSKIFNYKIAYILFLIGALCFFYKIIFYFNILHNYGYYAIYSGNFVLPFFVRIFDDFFYFGFLMIIMNKPDKKYAYKLGIFFILMYSTYFFTGMRAEFLLILLSTLWLYSLLYNVKIKMINFIFIVLILILISQLNQIYTYSNNLSDFNIAFLFKFFYSQGITLLVPGYVIEWNDYFFDNNLNGIRHFVAYFTEKITTIIGISKKASLEAINQNFLLGDRLTYLLDENKFFSGGGTGGSFVAELYILAFGNIFLLLIFCVITGYIIIYIQKKLIYKKYGLFISAIMINGILYMPRSVYIKFIGQYILAILILIVLKIIYTILKQNNKRILH